MNIGCTVARPPGPPANELASVTEYNLPLFFRCFQQYGDIYRLPPVPGTERESEVILLSHPACVKQVLSGNHTNYTKGIGIDRVRILLGNGIMASEGRYWHSQRKRIQPAFHPNMLHRFSPQMQACNRFLLEKWLTAARADESINMTADLSFITLDFILKAIFSEDVECIIAEHGSNPFEIVTEETTRDLQFAYRFRQLTHLVREVIARRRESGNRPFDFLSMMMDARDRKTDEKMTDKQLVDECMTLIIAGHETTASALNWTWYLLSQHVDVAATLQKEVDTVLQGREPSLDDLPQLPYAKQVLHEALRLYPPGWILTRRSIDDVTIGDYEIESDTDIFISPYIIHRHPDYWPDPEHFDPMRFTPEKCAERHRFSYLPFAAGARNCIGDYLAMCEMHLHLAAMTQHLQVIYHGHTPVGLDDLAADVNLRAKAPLPLTLIPR